MRKQKTQKENVNDCLFGRTSHRYSGWRDVLRDGKIITIKICDICTHTVNKSDYLLSIDATKTEGYKFKNHHIDLFKP